MINGPTTTVSFSVTTVEDVLRESSAGEGDWTRQPVMVQN